MKIIKNPDEEIYNSVTQAVKDNDGYCPCMLTRTDDSKCICKEFRQQESEGECHCGRYIKVEDVKHNE
jgi:ferredoxin-thioredoxin reductase catalytic subunit